MEGKAPVLINLAYFEEYLSPDNADQAILKALEEEVPLQHIVKFYRRLRDDRNWTDYLRRLSVVAQRASNEVLKELCKDWEEINRLFQTKDQNNLICVVNHLENLISKFRNDIGVEELGKLMNRILNTASEKLEKDGDKYLNTHREDAIKCYEGSAKGYQIFTMVRPDNPVDFANLVIILSKLKNLKPEDEENIDAQIRGHVEKIDSLPLQSDVVRFAGKIAEAYKMLGQSSERKGKFNEAILMVS